MRTSWVFSLVILVVFAFVAIILVYTSQPSTATKIQATTNPTATNNQNTNTQDQPVKELTIVASNYQYSIPAINLQQGERVKLTLKSIDGTHDLVIDDLNIATGPVSTGSSKVIEFIAEQTGVFEYYCSVGNHKEMGMVGQLIIE